jgi:hypothetical protein
MKDSEELLNKTFRLARRGREPLPSELPFGLETSVLAEWRSARAKPYRGMLPIFRWAAIVAIVCALVSGLWRRDLISRITDRYDAERAIIDSTFSVLNQ